MEPNPALTLRSGEVFDKKPVIRRGTGFPKVLSGQSEKAIVTVNFTPIILEGVKGRKSVLTHRGFTKSCERPKTSTTKGHRNNTYVYQTQPSLTKIRRSIGVQTLYEQISQEDLEDKEAKILLCKRILFENETRKNFDMNFENNEKMMEDALKSIRNGTIKKFEEFMSFVMKRKSLYNIQERPSEENKHPTHTKNSKSKNSHHSQEDLSINTKSKISQFSEQSLENLSNSNQENNKIKMKNQQIKTPTKKLPRNSVQATVGGFSGKNLHLGATLSENQKKNHINPQLSENISESQTAITAEIKAIWEKSGHFPREEEKLHHKSFENIESLTDIEEIQDSSIANSANSEEFIGTLINKNQADDDLLSKPQIKENHFFEYDNQAKNKESPLKFLPYNNIGEIHEIPENLEENSGFIESTIKSKNPDSLVSDLSSSSLQSSYIKNSQITKRSISISSDLYKSQDDSKINQKKDEENASIKKYSNYNDYDKSYKKKELYENTASQPVTTVITDGDNVKNPNFVVGKIDEIKVRNVEKNKVVSKEPLLPPKARSQSRYLDVFSTTTHELLSTIFKKTLEKKASNAILKKSQSDTVENAIKATELSKTSAKKDTFRQDSSGLSKFQDTSKTSENRSKSSLNNRKWRISLLETQPREQIQKKQARGSMLVPISQRPRTKRQSYQQFLRSQTILTKTVNQSFLIPQSSIFIENTTRLILFLIIKLQEDPKNKFERDTINRKTPVSKKSLNLCVTVAQFITGTYIFNHPSKENVKQEETDDIKKILNGFFPSNKVKPTKIDIEWPDLNKKDPEKITPESVTIRDTIDNEAKNRLKLKLRFLHDCKSQVILNHSEKVQIKNIDDSFDVPKKPERNLNPNSETIKQEIKNMQRTSRKKFSNYKMIRASSTHYRCKFIDEF